MTQVTYKTEKLSKKRVYYTGSDTLKTGYALCYDRDTGTASESDINRAINVEKPATANLNYFAGVVDAGSAGKTGPCYIDIVQPTGALVECFTDQNCTILVTKLGPQNASYALGAAGAAVPGCAIAMQTVDRSGTNGTVLAQLSPVNPNAVDVAAAVTATQDTLTLTSMTGTANTAPAAETNIDTLTGTLTGELDNALTNVTFNATWSQEQANEINKNFKEIQAELTTQRALNTVLINNCKTFATQLNAVKADIAALITALKNASLMA
ncbi:MAG: hypothetical protein GXY83_15650 [Rhodopirellula sp.]|nr:hypothetical protein [Rhodopirellula sp.]